MSNSLPSDVARRKFLLAGSALAAAPFLSLAPPARAASPLVLAVIPTLITALFSLWSDNQRRKQEELALAIQVRLKQAEMSFEYRKALLQSDLSVWEQQATGRLENQKITANGDGHGSELALVNGRIHAARNGFGGVMNPAEGMFAADWAQGERTPVPINLPLFMRVDSPRDRQMLAEKLSVDANSRILADDILGTRPYSRARTPTANGHDITAIAVALDNNPNARIAKKLGVFGVAA